VVIDPLDVPCPRCHEPRDKPCVRVTGPYGQGNPLRRMHKQRFEEARRWKVREAAAARARYLRRHHAPGSPAPH
jgi:hypothetical protein